MKGFRFAANGLLGLLVLLSSIAVAQSGQSTAKAEGAESEKKWGAILSVGNPFPTLLGLNAAYNINHDLRASVGYGEVEVTSGFTFDGNGFSEQKVKAQTYAVGAEYMFLDYAVRPVVGAHLSYFHISGDGDFDINGIHKTSFYGYSNLGIDWTAKSGFNIGAGLNVALLNASGSSGYLNAGWFF